MSFNSNFTDVFTNHLDPAHIFFPSGAQTRSEERQDATLELQQQAFDYQKEYDAQQYQLATSPISTVLNDASKVGINPMAALGQNVGSVNSSVQSPSGVSPISGNNTSGLLGTVASALTSAIASVKNVKMQTEAQKDIADAVNQTRQDELDIIDKHNKEVEDIERNKNRINENYYNGQLAINRETNQIEWGRLSNDQYNTILNYIKESNLNAYRKAELSADLYKFQQKLSQDASQFTEHEKKETMRTWIKSLCYAIPSLVKTLTDLIPNIKGLFSAKEISQIGFHN